MGAFHPLRFPPPLVLSALIFFLIRSSGGLPSTHPLHSMVDRINESGPFIAVVMADSTEAEALHNSGYFVPRSDVPYVDLYGRRFHIGSIHNVDVIYVMCGERRLNAGTAIQTLLTVFDIWGIVHYGTAGSASNSLSFGDVSIPQYVAFTGSWRWMKFDPEGDSPDLIFGDFSIPNKTQNLLAGLKFKTEEFYPVGKPMEYVFWMQVDLQWLSVAKNLKVKLERCTNETTCLSYTPKMVSGLRASTADIFVDNAAYREFLNDRFDVSTADEESSAIVMTAASPGIPVIVFRGASDLAGGQKGESTKLAALASINSLKVAVEFVKEIGKTKKSAF